MVKVNPPVLKVSPTFTDSRPSALAAPSLPRRPADQRARRRAPSSTSTQCSLRCRRSRSRLRAVQTPLFSCLAEQGLEGVAGCDGELPAPIALFLVDLAAHEQ